ncbi:RidA family protein [Paracoccaceae bacterium GXU_MW_L88]
MSAKHIPINAANAPQSAGGYAQAVLTENAQRILHISGQIPVDLEGNTPPDFADQARLAWANVIAQLEAAEMGLTNLVSHRTYLADRRYREANSAVRQEVLGDHQAALTVIIADIYDPAWLLEIEAVAIA